MGYELYCGLEQGTLNVLSTVVMSFILENATPEEVAKFIADRTYETGLKRLRRGESTYWYLEDGRPVDNWERLKEYRNEIYNIWIEAARRKLEECYKENKWGEAVTMIEFPTGEIKIDYPSSLLGLGVLAGAIMLMYLVKR